VARTYDKCFGIIAQVRGLVGKDQVAAAEAEALQRQMAGIEVTIAKVLMEQAGLKFEDMTAVEEAMRSHAFDCTACAATTYLLPRQREDDIKCERCGAPTRRQRAVHAGAGQKLKAEARGSRTSEYGKAVVARSAVTFRGQDIPVAMYDLPQIMRVKPELAHTVVRGPVPDSYWELPAKTVMTFRAKPREADRGQERGSKMTERSGAKTR